jgi:hypothetical protein
VARIVSRVGIYLLAIVAILALSGGLIGLRSQGRQDGGGSLPVKTRYYLSAPERFGGVYLGDSRTYTDFHPELLDARLGLTTYNLAHWTNWFPTQYAQIDDIVGHIPAHAYVVWSFGYQQFTEQPVTLAYPVGLRRVGEYLARGFDPCQIAANLANFTPGLNLIEARAGLLRAVEATLDRVPRSFVAAGAAAGGAEVEPELLARVRADPLTDIVELYRDDAGHLASIAVSLKNGAYMRYELEPTYYRTKQAEVARETENHPDSGRFIESAKSWALFTDVLRRFAAHRTRLIVNVLEEAPFRYDVPGSRDKSTAFMNGKVRAAVEAAGFPYVSVDFDRFEDADYFDFNHLNSTGVQKFSDMVAPLLRDAMTRQR